MKQTLHAVTGAFGYSGKYIARRLLDLGKEVITLTNSLERKYGPNASENTGKSSGVLADYVAVGVAAMTATTVFFTCTVAFVGLVLVAAADGEWFWPTLGMLAFSSAFVLPFFLLALFPSAAQRMRTKGGSWIKAVSVTLGFVELAAALKFFSNAELVWQLGILPRELFLFMWAGTFGLAAAFLLGWINLKGESKDE